MGHRAPSHSKQPCPGTRGSAWVDETTPLLLVGTTMDESNSNTSQNENTLNDGAANTSLGGDVRVEDHQTEGPQEFGTADAKRCKLDEPKQGTEQQMTEDNVSQSEPKCKTPPLPAQSLACPSQIARTSKPNPGNPVSKKAKKRKRASAAPNFGAGAIERTNNPFQFSNEFHQSAFITPAEDRSTFPSFRFMSVKIKLGLCAADHPRVYLNNFQLDTLAQLILNIILGPEGERVKPRFYGMNMINGHLMLVCGDYATAAWVKELPMKLFLGDVRLKAVEWTTESKSFVAVGHFPKSEHETVERILRFLEVQNQGLDCSQWKVMDRNPEKKKAVRMTFAVDWASAQLLKAKGPLLNFKFSKARFVLKTKGAVKFKEEEDKDDDDGDGDGDLEFVDSFPATNEFVSPFLRTNPFAQTFDYGFFPYGMPLGGQMQSYPGVDFGGDYSAEIAAAVRMAKTALHDGFTSSEGFLVRKKKKKKKKAKAKTGPS